MSHGAQHSVCSFLPTCLGVLCDPSYCDGSEYRCNVKDGSCDYNVECAIGTTAATPTVTGRCD